MFRFGIAASEERRVIVSDFTPFQASKLSQLRDELQKLRPDIPCDLPKKGKSPCGYGFTEVEGTTVVVIARETSKSWGGYKLPSVMTYPERGVRPKTSLDAAVWADRHYRQQSRESVRDFGHFGSIINTGWFCNDRHCPCNDEFDIARRKDRSLSGNRKSQTVDFGSRKGHP